MGVQILEKEVKIKKVDGELKEGRDWDIVEYGRIGSDLTRR